MPAKDEHLVSDVAEISSILSSLQRLHSQISVHFRGTDQNFLSMIVDVDRDKQVFYLDELSLPSAHKRAEAGDVFSVRGSANGVSVFFNHCQVERVINDEGAALYQVPFPKSLAHTQKRDAYRARVMRSMQVKASLLSYERKNPLIGVLLDISNTGCRLGFKQLVDPKFRVLEIFEELYLQLPEPFEGLEVAVEARHAVYNEQQNTTSCGFRFINVDGKVQTVIDRFVIHLQREALRLDVR